MKRKRKHNAPAKNIIEKARTALQTGEDLNRNDVSITTADGITTVRLYGVEAVTYNRKNEDITLNGRIICTRKSCRYMNLVVMSSTPYWKVESHYGRWYMRHLRTREMTDFTDRPFILYNAEDKGTDIHIPVMGTA